MISRLESYLSEFEQNPALTLSIVPASPETSEIIKDLSSELSWVRTRPLWGETSENILRFTDGESLATVDYVDGFAQLQIAPATVRDENFFARTFFLLAVIELLRTQDFFYAHAALVSLGTRAILILGQGGSGKSTLAARLMTQGWKIHGDDNVLLRLDAHGKCVAYPLERELSLSEEMAHKLNLAGTPKFERDKVRYTLDQFTQSFFAGASVTEIISLTPEHMRREDCPTGADIMKVLITENPLILANSQLAVSHLLTLRQLVKQASRTSLPPRPPSETLVELMG